MSFIKYCCYKLNPFYKPNFKVGDVGYFKEDKPFKDEPASAYYKIGKVGNNKYKLVKMGSPYTEIRESCFIDATFLLENDYE